MKKIKLYTQYKKISADTLTPVQVYMKIRDQFNKPLLLESSEHHNKRNDFSYICFEPLSSITLENGSYLIDEIPSEKKAPIAQMVQYQLNRFEVEHVPFPFVCNGLFGYTGYHAVPYHESIHFKKSTEIPEMYYALYQYVLVFDHYHDEMYVFSHHLKSEESSSNLNRIIELIQNKPVVANDFFVTGTEKVEIGNDDFKALVKTVKEHCQRGDVFQMVLSRKFSQSFIGDEFNVYRALRNINPSPYLFYFDYGNFKLFGSSPESQLIVNDQTVIAHPIAGTVRRSGNAEVDRQLMEQLRLDPKENAEHVMLVDLARNDISINCKEVKLNYYKELHQYSHVIHMVSEVTGQLKPDENAYEVMMDAFPAGTLSGAPKHKAMQLINKFEKSPRSYYGGCIGMIDFQNNLHHAILIRSFLSKANHLYYQAGAGIVLSSTEEGELQEVNNKINALRKAIQYANKLESLKN